MQNESARGLHRSTDIDGVFDDVRVTRGNVHVRKHRSQPQIGLAIDNDAQSAVRIVFA